MPLKMNPKETTDIRKHHSQQGITSTLYNRKLNNKRACMQICPRTQLKQTIMINKKMKTKKRKKTKNRGLYGFQEVWRKLYLINLLSAAKQTTLGVIINQSFFLWLWKQSGRFLLQSGKWCVFPFEYNARQYTECSGDRPAGRPWCGTTCNLT